jgi:hypothetical protein
MRRLSVFERNLVAICYETKMSIFGCEHGEFGDCETCAENAFYEVMLAQLERHLNI